ncbi:hypothetical protein EGW08_016512 [Elysia chlorotica]|uniref:Uncharacterized protein n=1 Tax=Elysia chlorotica TaxID=188477 RepID=A0A3S0ZUR8_ELYCH|nr:hypothetical protein EGW08_016512 [Elysia chlorotica]
MKLSLICFVVLLAAISIASAASTRREKRFLNLKKIYYKVKDLVKKTAGKVENMTLDRLVDKADYALDKSLEGLKTAANYTKEITNKVIDKADTLLDKYVEKVKSAAKYTVKFGKKVVKISRKVYQKTYNASKTSYDAIEKLASVVPLDDAILRLVDMVGSDTSDSACDITCVSSANYILSSTMAFMANKACPLICDAGLAYLEDVAETLVEDSFLAYFLL